jgi:hypothetical protein
MKSLTIIAGFLILTSIRLWSQEDLSIFNFSITGGLTYFANDQNYDTDGVVNPKTVEDYSANLSTGYNAGTKMAFQMNRLLAIGLEYKFHFTQAECYYYHFSPMSYQLISFGRLWERKMVHYAGPGIYFTNILNTKKVMMQAGISGGWSWLRVENFDRSHASLKKSNNFMISCSLGAEIPLTPFLSILTDVSCNFAKVDDVDVENSLSSFKRDYPNILNFNLTTGIKFVL